MHLNVHENLDKAIFKRLLFIASIISLLHTIHIFFLMDDPGPRIWIAPIVTIVLFLFYTFLSKINNFIILKLSFYPLLLTAIFLGFIINNGLAGMFPFEVAILILFTICMFENFWMFVFLLIDALLVLLCCWIQYYHPEWAPNNQGINFEWLDIFDITSRIFAISSLVWVMKSEYDSKLKSIGILNQELETKNKEIITQRSKILEINNNLSSMVKERTLKLESVNQQLTDYAFFNSHKVRGPLARIIGVVNLIKISKESNNIENQEIENYIELLEKSTSDLDIVIKDLNRILS